MKIGLVIGKFYPPHEGHHSVIDRALAECDDVIVGILWSEHESITGLQRWKWLSEEHPAASIVRVQDEYPVDYDSDEAWVNHMKCIRHVIIRARSSQTTITHVYGSEKYILRLARELDAEPVLVDIARRKHQVSGTAIRRAPHMTWDYLRSATKAGLCKRVVCVGAESCGTTTLTKSLADTFLTVWVPEYGRLYTEGLRRSCYWDHSDLQHIADMQQAFEDQMARHSRNGLLFCDTNALATRVWEEFLVGPSHIADPHADLYILTDLCPWEDDGTRFLRDRREAMQERFKEVLDAQPVPWIEVTGDHVQRINATFGAIAALEWDFAQPLG